MKCKLGQSRTRYEFDYSTISIVLMLEVTELLSLDYFTSIPDELYDTNYVPKASSAAEMVTFYTTLEDTYLAACFASEHGRNDPYMFIQ
jgi:hypothetical protein